MIYRNVILLSGLSVISLSVSAGTMDIGTSQLMSSKVYLGGFGGVVGTDRLHTNQSAVAYRFIGQLFPGQTTSTDENYDLYVNVTGTSKTNTGGIAGLHIGYLLNELNFGSNQQLNIAPRLELEGYYLGTKMSGALTNPVLEPAVLRPEGTVSPTHSISAYQHIFVDNFNLNMGVLMFNTIFDLRTSLSSKYIPYAGAGIGFVFNTLSGANSDQTMPYNENVNHFNTNTKATSSIFSGQTRVGMRTQVSDHLSLFAEYRYLYASPSSYTLGNTYYPGYHPDTSKWNVSLGSMNFQTGVFGIDYIC